jgi:nicotinate phosphoribosyltransferase
MQAALVTRITIAVVNHWGKAALLRKAKQDVAYDTEAAARKVVALARRLQASGIKVGGVRLDSGDLVVLARSVRRILDEGGLNEVTIFASGGLDEDDLMEFARRNVPIDGYGMGTSLVTSSDTPALDCAYKLE